MTISRGGGATSGGGVTMQRAGVQVGSRDLEGMRGYRCSWNW